MHRPFVRNRKIRKIKRDGRSADTALLFTLYAGVNFIEIYTHI